MKLRLYGGKSKRGGETYGEIEYFSEKDVRYAVNEILRAAGTFFCAPSVQEEVQKGAENALFEEKPEVD